MDFISFCRERGILIDHLPALGKWRRFATVDKPRKKNGAVLFMGEYGVCQNHATMEKAEVWSFIKGDKQAAVDDFWLKRLRSIAEREKRARNAAVADLRAWFSKLPRLSGAPKYVENKGLDVRGCAGCRLDGENLVIPMYIGGELFSAQTITPQGDKKFKFNCPVKQAYFPIEGKTWTLTAFCEGFATGLAIYQCVPRCRVIVCFSASNMLEAAKFFRMSNRIRGEVVVCADNDHQTEIRTGENAGVSKGRETADFLRCRVAYPVGISGTDWCDAFNERGRGFVRNNILREVYKPVVG